MKNETILAALPFLMVAAIPLASSPVNAAPSAAANAASRAKSLPPEIQAGLDGGGSGFLSLTWNEPVVTQSEWANQELTLRFSRPLADAPIAEVGSRLGDAVESLRYGYDSVLLRLSPGFEPRVETTGTGVVVTLGRSAASLAARPISPGSTSSEPRRCSNPARSLRRGPSCSTSSPMRRFLRISRVPPGRRESMAAAATSGAAFQHSTGCCAPIPAIPSCSPITRLF